MTNKRTRVERDECFWEKVRREYQAGVPQAQLRRKYRLSPSTLASRIKRDGWRLSQEQTQAVQEFEQAAAKVSESFSQANVSQKAEILERITTTLEDYEITVTNRRLIRGLQAQTARAIKGRELEPAEINALSNATQKFEQIANPSSGKQQNTQVNIGVEAMTPKHVSIIDQVLEKNGR